MFKEKIKNLKYFEAFFCKSAKDSMKDDVFQMVLVRDGGENNNGHDTF